MVRSQSLVSLNDRLLYHPEPQLALGKREIWSVEQMAAHRVDASFVPMDETVMEPHITSIHTSVETRAQTGLYGPFPTQSFSAEQCSEAFKYLRTAGHIGKVSSKSGQCGS